MTAVTGVGVAQQADEPQVDEPRAKPRAVPGGQVRQVFPRKVEGGQLVAPMVIINRDRFNRAVPEDLLDLDRIKRAQIPQEILRQVQRLASDDFTEREAASEELRSSPLPDEVLIAVLERKVLEPEQRNRLLRTLRWRVRDRPRGAVGIRMNTSRKGVVVTELVPDLPAERVLKVGDQIIQINDTEVRSNNDLVGVVQQLLPGTRIRMTILRPIPQDDRKVAPDEMPEERVEVEFPLGSYAKLDNEPEALGLTNPETERRNMMVRAIQQRYGSTAALLDNIVVSETDATRNGN
ncbi:MAG: PDZ domain-containing protein [Phycisphaerales bacterium]|nr:PDZ domain-containing protein [Phycisphaerales bacterium]